MKNPFKSKDKSESGEAKGFSEILDAELAKDSPDKEAIKAAVAAEVEAAVAEALQTPVDSDKIEALEAENASLKEKLEQSELTAKDPNAARLRAINGDKVLEVEVQEEGKARKAKFIFKREQFTDPKEGVIKAADVLANPERYQSIISRLIERNSPILIEVGKRKKSK